MSELSAVRRALEAAAKVCEELSAKTLSAQGREDGSGMDAAASVNKNIRMAAILLPDAAIAIRALRAEDFCNDQREAAASHPSPAEQELPASAVSAASVSPVSGSLGSEASDVQQPAPAAGPGAGDYVLATKWSDGDPGDHWFVGFYDRQEGDRHYVVDGDGNQGRGNGFRKVASITEEEGAWLLSNGKKWESLLRVKSVWDYLNERRHAEELDRLRGEVERLTNEGSLLAAGQCIVKDGLLMGEGGHAYCAMRERAERAEAALRGGVVVPEEVIRFLCGEVPIDGLWFGEPKPSKIERPEGKPLIPAHYWWRSQLLRPALAAAKEGKS